MVSLCSLVLLFVYQIENEVSTQGWQMDSRWPVKKPLGIRVGDNMMTMANYY
jgi:hypothetical protein